jgi:hypothetical protein
MFVLSSAKDMSPHFKRTLHAGDKQVLSARDGAGWPTGQIRGYS